jgi:hypothetical protein
MAMIISKFSVPLDRSGIQGFILDFRAVGGAKQSALHFPVTSPLPPGAKYTALWSMHPFPKSEIGCIFVIPCVIW